MFFDNFLLAPGTWDSFSGGISSWTLGRPSFLGISLAGAYAFYLFTLGVFLAAVLAVWNLSRSKTGRVLRAIRNSEIAAATSGVNLDARGSLRRSACRPGSPAWPAACSLPASAR